MSDQMYGLASSTVHSTYINKILDTLPKNPVIQNGAIKGFHILQRYDRPVCTVSGGSDSDVMMDLIIKLDPERKVDFVWCNPGLEYVATKRQIEYLENSYDRPIVKVRPKVNVIQSCRAHGLPFLSKRVSDCIQRLQNLNFDYEDRPAEELLEKYCQIADPERALYLFSLPEEKRKRSGWCNLGEGWYRGGVSAVLWWCNAYKPRENVESQFNISQNKFLKEFLMEYPPDISISPACCQNSKKDLIHDLIKEHGYHLDIYGVRKVEGGERATAYNGTCFSSKEDGCDEYRPLYFYTAQEKQAYEQCFGIHHSDCYAVYGFKRTGCSCCPFARNLEQELSMAGHFEPNIYKAAWNVFGKSYEYTRKYRSYVAEKKRGYKLMDFADLL